MAAKRSSRKAIAPPPPPRAVVAPYWQESTRPLVSFLFVLPMLLVYEAGILIQGAETARNGADVWLRQLLDWLGFGQFFLLPVLTCSVLLGWHHATEQAWNCSTGVFSRMLVESTVFAIALFMGAQIQSLVFAAAERATTAVTLATQHQVFTHVLGYLGAGIYEELMFRLLLVPAIYGLFRAAGGSPRLCMGVAVTLSSLMFAAAHYQFDLKFAHWNLTLAQGYPFDWFSFVFRFWAGMFFGLLFVYRGFGIAVGAHALYDILTIVF